MCDPEVASFNEACAFLGTFSPRPSGEGLGVRDTSALAKANPLTQPLSLRGEGRKYPFLAVAPGVAGLIVGVEAPGAIPLWCAGQHATLPVGIHDHSLGNG